MSAVISGNGLGLFNGSASQIGTGLGGGARLGQGRDQQYVNIATGNLLLHSQDEQLLFRGLGIAAQRTYNSRGQLSQVGADAWITGFERRVELLSGTLNAAGSVMRRHTGDGSYQDFAFVSADLYRSTTGDGAHDTLSRDGGANTWTWVEGSTRREEQYANHADAVLKGRLTRIRDLKSDGSAPVTWNVLYDAGHRLSEVRAEETGSAEALLFGYDANGRLSSLSTRINGVVNEQVAYAYDAAGRLSSVQVDLTPADASGDRDAWDAANLANNDGYRFRTDYRYVDATSLLLSQLQQSDGTLVSYTYDAQGRVRTLTRGDSNADDSDGVGQTLSFSYDEANRSTEVADSTGRSWGYVYDAAGQLVEVRSPAVAGVRDLTQYSYDAAGNLTRVKALRGGTTLSETVYQYDANGNALWQWNTVDPASGTAATAVQRTYTANHQLASETVYTGLDADRELGAQAAGGGLTTSYVYDARDRVRFVIDPLGAVREFEYETVGAGAGQVAKSRQYLGAAYTGAMTLAGLTAWATGAQRAQSLLSESSYDNKGRLAGTKTYAAVDGSGNGVDNDAAEIVQYLYDAHGQLTQRRTMRSSTAAADDGRDISHTVTYLYDGLGRRVSEVGSEKLGAGADQLRRIASRWIYQDSGASVRTIIEGGAVNDGITGNDLLRVEVRNAAGQLLSVSESALGGGGETRSVSKHYYDSAGRLRASEDAGGARSYSFYDEQGRLAGQVDETGAVVEYVRDELGRVIQTKSYATRVDTGAWLAAGAVVPATVAAIRPAATGDDRVVTRAYDALGRLRSEHFGAGGAVTLYSYDGAGRLLQTSIEDGDGNARSTRYFYDAQGRQTGVLDAEGYLVEHRYDPAGRRIASTAYATATATAQRAAGSLAQLRPATHAADQTTRWFHDGRGNTVGQLDAEGYLTEFVFDEARNERAVRAYARQLTGLSGSESFASLRGSAAANNGAVRETRRSYDSLGQLSTERNAEGTVTRYSYDAQGRLLRSETAADTSELREGRLRYNVFGELIGELDGEGAARVLPGMSEAQLDALYAQYGVRHSYNNLGQRIESIDAGGHKTWYFYDAAGRPSFTVKGVADAAGVANAQGEVNEIRYNAFGEVRDSTAYSGRITLATAGSRDSAASAIGTLAYVVASDSRRSIVYTNRGRIARTVDAEGVNTRYTYNAFDEQIREERASGSAAASISEFQYDRRGLLTARTEAVGKTEQRSTGSSYDAFGRVISTTDARGIATTFAYDRLGRQISRSHPAYSATVQIRTSYDAYGRVLTQTDARGYATTYAYDDAARSVTVVTPEGSRVVTVHNRHGQTVTVTSNVSAGKTVTRSMVYDRDGLLVESRDGLGNTARSEYDARGLLSATVDASGRRIELRYDAAGRVLQRIEDPAGLALTTSYAYDGQGRQLSVTDASGRLSRQRYDREGRLLELAVDPTGLNLRTGYAYDALGRQITVTDPAGQSVRYDYDALGRRVAERVDPAGLNLTTSYVYDSNDNLIRRTDAAGATTRFYYDNGNRLIHTIDPAGGVTRQWLDASDRIVTVRSFATAIDPAALTAATTVAQVDALLSWQSADQGESRIYDQDGRLRFTLDRQSTLTETLYDQAGRILATRRYATRLIPDSALLSAMFAGTATPAGILAHANFPGRNDALDQTEYRLYDDAGRVRLVMNGLGAVVAYGYDADGRTVEEKRYAHPVAGASLAAAKAAILANTASVATILSYLPAGQDPVSYRVYDAAGRARYTIDAAGAVQELFLDAAGRSVGSRAYATALALPAALRDKIRSGDKSAQADLAAQIASAGLADDARDVRSYQVFDSAGRMRHGLDALGFVRSYGYDGAGRIVSEKSYARPAALTAALRTRLLAGTAAPAELDAVVTGIALEDRNVERVYDLGGRLRYELTWVSNTHKTVSERRYDAAGRTLATIAYGVTIATSTASTLAAVAAAVNGTGGNAAAKQQQTRYVYDAAGQLRFSVDAAGAVAEQRYDGLGQVVESRRYGGWIPAATAMTEAAVAAAVAGQTDTRSVRTAYDAAGRVLTVTDALNQVERYAYDALGQVTGYTNRNGHTWNYGYDLAGRRTSETTPEQWILTVDSAGTQSFVTRRVVTRTQYDALGNVIARIENADTTQSRTTRYEYDSRGYQVRTIFPDAGKIDPATGQLVASGIQPTIEVGYDALGRAVVQKDVRGNHSYKVYDALDQLLYDIDAENYVTGNSYDGFGQKTQLRRYATRLNTAAMAGWSAGQPITLAQIRGAGAIAAGGNDRTITTTYDLRGLAVRVEQTQVSYYTAAGDIASGSPTVQVEYDAYGRMVKESVLLEGVAGQSSARWADSYLYYDELGRVVMTVDAEGYVTRTRYNATGEVLDSVEYAKPVSLVGLSPLAPPNPPPSGDEISGYDRVTRYGYDALGRKSIQALVRHFQRNDGSAGVRDVFTEFRYDGEGRVIELGTDLGVTKTRYDALGQTISITEPLRRVVTDASFGQLAAGVGTDLNSAALYQQASPFTEMIYDAFGNLVQTRRYGNGRAADGSGAWDNARDQVELVRYDWQGRAVATSNSHGDTVYSDYDAADNVLHRWYTLRSSDSARDQRAHSWYGYDKTGRQTATVQTRAPVSGGASVTDMSDRVVYNAFGEIVQKNHVGLQDSLLYRYDGAGRLISSNETGAFKNFGYNLAGHQLRQSQRIASNDGQTYDAVTWHNTDRLGRETVTRRPSHTTDPNASTVTQQRLDRWGNVLEMVDARGYRTHYRYNETNQVTRDERPIVEVVSETGVATWVRPVNQWFYDALGRRIGTRDANGNTRSNEYDGAGRLVASRDALGQATAFAYDALGNQRITQNPKGYLTYQDYDRLGRVTEIGDYLANGAGGRSRSALQRYWMNLNGDRVAVFDALGQFTRYEYDSRSLMVRSQTAMGVVQNTAYDAQGRKIREGFEVSNPTSVQDREGEWVRLEESSWDYDVFGRLIDHNNLSGRDFDYRYHAETGQLTYEGQAGGAGPAWEAGRYNTYYANGLVKSIHEFDATPTYRYEYDAAGNRTLEEVNTLDAGGQPVRTITRTWYDSNNRVQRVLQDDLSGGAAKRVFDLRYSYDAVGNRRRVEAAGGYGPGSATVPTINTAPELVQAPRSRSLHKGDVTEFALVFNEVFLDRQQDPLSLQISLADGGALPSWLSARRDTATGQILFTARPAANAADQDLQIRLLVSETGNPGHAVATTFTLYVRNNVGPELLNPATEVVKVALGSDFSKTLSAGDYFFDLDIGDTLRLSLDNAASLPPWLGFDPSTMRLYTVAPNTAGSFAVFLRATDQNGWSVVKTIQITVAANTAPSGSTPLPSASIVGQDLNWSSPLSQVFNDADGDELTITASGVPAWMSFQRVAHPSRPELRLVGQVPPGIDLGTVQTITFTATDRHGASASRTLTLTVRGNEPPRAPASFGAPPAAVGHPYRYQLPPFTDPEGDAVFHQTSALPPGLSFDPATRTISGTATAAGAMHVFYSGTDQYGAGSVTSFYFNAYVNHPPVASSIPNQTGGVGSPFAYEIPEFTDAGGGMGMRYSATGLPPGLNMDASGIISGTPGTAGQYTVTVTGSDGLETASTRFVITIHTVAPANRAPIRNHTPQTVAMEISESSPANGWNSWPVDAFIDPDGNPLSYQLINTPAWVDYSFGRGLYGGHQFDFYPPGQNGSYTVTVRATDHLGAYVDMSFTLIVSYRPGGGGVPRAQPNEAAMRFDMGSESQVEGPQSQLSTDENGNATANAPASTPTPIDVRDYWFTYDEENRIKINNGRLINNQVVLVAEGGDSYQLAYDAAGNAVTRSFYRGNDLKVQRSDYDLRGNRTVEYHEQTAGVPSYLGVDRVFSYDANRRQLGSRRYFGDGARYTYTSRPGELYEEYDSYDLGGWLSQAENFAYDADGRLLFQDSWTRKDDYATWVRSAAQDNANGRQSTDAGVLDRRQNRVEYLDANGQSTYDRTGKATGFRQFGDGYVHTFATTYEGWESYQEKRVTGSSSNNNYKATTNTLEYDPYGRLKWQVENTPLKNGSIDDRIRYYAYNGDGQVQTRREGTIQNGQFTQADAVKPNYLYVYAGGQQMAQLREGPKGIQSLSGMGMYDAGGARVTAMPGESLRQLAQRVYGNDQLWYVLAQANGLGDPDQEIGGGLQLDAPKVDVSRNDANTFKPYNPAEAMGPTTPSLPYVPPPPPCDTLGTLLMIVVAVAVAVGTWGAMTAPAASAVAGTYGGAAATGAAATGLGASAGAVGATGAATATGISFSTGVYAGAVSGAASSLAGQAVGSAMGVTSFNWRGVIAGGVTGAITGGMYAQWGSVGQALTGANPSYLKAAGLALGTAGAGYAGQKAAGMDVSFSWRGIAADAIGNLVSAQISESVGLPPSKNFEGAGNFGADLANGLIGGVVSVHTRRAFGFNDKIDYGRIVLDAFGNALGNALGKDIATGIRDIAASHGLKGSARGAYGDLRKAGYDPEQARRILSQPDLQQILAARDQRESLAKSMYEADSFDSLTTEQKEILLRKMPRHDYGPNRDSIKAEYLPRDDSNGLEININGGHPTSTQKSTMHSFGIAVSGVIFEGKEALGNAIETLGEDNVRGAVVVAQFALGGIPKTVIGLAADGVAGEWVNQKIDQYVKTPLSNAYSEGVFRATSPDEVEAVRPASDSAAAFTIGLASTLVSIGATMGREMLVNAARNTKNHLAIAKNKLEVVLRDRWKAGNEIHIVTASRSGPAKGMASQVGAVGDDVSQSAILAARKASNEAKHDEITIIARPNYLSSAEFKKIPQNGTIDPRMIRYSQDSASANFKPPYGSVDDFVEGLRSGSIDPGIIKPIRIVERNGNIFTLDNRRLYSFEQAGIAVPYEKLDAIPKRELFKFTTINDGTSILIRKKE